MSLQNVTRYLVDNLRGVSHISSVRVLDQGALLVDVAQPSFHEEIVIYVLAGELSVGFIKKTLNANTRADRHTLYILSLSLLQEARDDALTSDGLRLLLQGYAGRIYAYEETVDDVRIVPVEFDSHGGVQVGPPVHLADLSGDYADFDSDHILGVRKVAGFTRRSFQVSVELAEDDPLAPFYALLSVPVSASVSDVKRAYRKLARRFHPDADPSPGATARMQEINEAYTRILERFGL